MTGLSLIPSILINKSNDTNYAPSNYTFTITPFTPIITLDVITIRFPVEVNLPDVNNLVCSVDLTK